MDKEYHIKVRDTTTGNWMLYTRTKDLKTAHEMLDEALELAKYDAVQINEVTKRFIYRKERTK